MIIGIKLHLDFGQLKNVLKDQNNEEKELVQNKQSTPRPSINFH